MNKSRIILLIVLIIFAISGIIFAEEFKVGTKLFEGKNVILFESDLSPIYVSELIKRYPEIATVTSNESEIEKGYVNVFGGVGEDFIIYPNKTYEITVQKEVVLNLK